MLDGESQHGVIYQEARDGSDEQTMQLASQVLGSDLYVHDGTGERYMVGHSSSRFPGKQTSLDQQMCLHMESVIVVTVMSCVETTLPVSVFQMARCWKSRMFWSLPHLYELFGLSCHGGVASKWILRGKQSWLASLRGAFGDGDLLAMLVRRLSPCPCTHGV